MTVESFISKTDNFITVHYYPIQKKVCLLSFYRESSARMKTENTVGMWKIKQLKQK